jgi:hypothetical protein
MVWKEAYEKGMEIDFLANTVIVNFDIPFFYEIPTDQTPNWVSVIDTQTPNWNPVVT